MSVVTVTAAGNSGATATPIVASDGDSVLVQTTGDNQGVKLPAASLGTKLDVFLAKNAGSSAVKVYNDDGSGGIVIQGHGSGIGVSMLETGSWYKH